MECIQAGGVYSSANRLHVAITLVQPAGLNR